MPKILIVDDEQPLRRLLDKILKESGYTCWLADNAQQARNEMEKQLFDLLLTDIHMPGESGMDLAAYAKVTYPTMAIMFVSVMDDPEEAQAALRMGVYGYLVKPFERNQALITIGNALIRRDLEVQSNHLRHHLEDTVRQRTAELTESLDQLRAANEKIAVTARDYKDQLLFFHALSDAIPNPIYYKDKKGFYQGCNSAFERYTGRPRSALIGKNIFDISPRQVAKHHHQTDLKLLRQPGKETYEASTVFADGTVHETLFSTATYCDSQGEAAGLVGVMVDITERKRIEQALRISEEKNRTILENIGIGVAVVDPRMRILEMNPKMKLWFGDTNADDRYYCYKVLVQPPRDKPCDGCPVFETLRDGQVHEAILQRRDGDRKRSLRIISSAIHDSEGRVVAAIELVDDITEHLAMERELRQAQKLSSLGQLAAGVAHEINNPVGFVSSNLMTLADYQNDLCRLIERYQSLMEACKNSEDKLGTTQLPLLAQIETLEAEIDIDYIQKDAPELIRECREGTDRIKKIVDDLKHFAHPGQDQVQDTDINRELESTLSVVHNELKYKATVIKEFGQLPLISANPQQLNQVFINILVNAGQAIENSGEIRVSTEHVNGHVIIRISDTGCGIRKEHLTRIFDPFFTTKEVGQGTGLGMNIVYNIIKKHHGDIRVESIYGEGTSFIITLPGELPLDDSSADIEPVSAAPGRQFVSTPTA